MVKHKKPLDNIKFIHDILPIKGTTRVVVVGHGGLIFCEIDQDYRIEKKEFYLAGMKIKAITQIDQSKFLIAEDFKQDQKPELIVLDI